MKKLLIFIVSALCLGTSYGQKFTELKEAKVSYTPFSMEVSSRGNSYSFNVREQYVGEFENNPTAFLQNNFDIKGFINKVKQEKYDGYEVTFRSGHGYLRANYDKEGQLLESSEKFKNVLLPPSLRHQIYRDHKGWAMVKNTHIAKGSKGLINKDFYKITLRNGKKNMRLNIDTPAEDSRVAVN